MRIILVLVGVLILQACSNLHVTISDAQSANNYVDLVNLFGYENCYKSGRKLECIYYKRYFDISDLTFYSGEYFYVLNNENEVIKKSFAETTATYHIMPPSQLPNYVNEFK